MTEESTNFVHAMINHDLETNQYRQKVHTRFPPEPNGYLHIGHAKAICLNFTTAEKYHGLCNLRFDDTNPIKEETEFVDSIQQDIRWLGFDWQDRLFYASDYFEQLYQYAVKLIRDGKAHVCDLSPEEMKEYRGSLTEAGRNCPCRNRPVAESLALFADMRAGKFPEGAKVLRANIDMASPNYNMRDPVLYRIQYSNHHRTGDSWCIYPMYDYAHPLSDAIEGITHSICTLEFENHRPLYDWVLINTGISERPRQIEFARLNLTHTVMSKRKLRYLVENHDVSGWDDPRMPTISGLRRRGYTPASIRDFCEKIGVAKSNSLVDIGLLEHCIREDLNQNAGRVFAVLDPIKVVITNYPAGQTELLSVENNPEKPETGVRQVPFGREIYIERDDFMEDPPPKYYRLSVGKSVRLKSAYIIDCQEAVKDETGKIMELHCTYDPATKSGQDQSGRKVKSTIHWLQTDASIAAEVRIYGHLFSKENPEDLEGGEDFTKNLNPDSLKILANARIEASVQDARAPQSFQFLRLGYFIPDLSSSKERPVFNRIVSLKDTWAKLQKHES